MFSNVNVTSLKLNCSLERCCYTVDMLWTAPEHLVSSDNTKTACTPSADIYSLAIVLQEVLLRTLPYQTGNAAVMLAKGNK